MTSICCHAIRKCGINWLQIDFQWNMWEDSNHFECIGIWWGFSRDVTTCNESEPSLKWQHLHSTAIHTQCDHSAIRTHTHTHTDTKTLAHTNTSTCVCLLFGQIIQLPKKTNDASAEALTFHLKCFHFKTKTSAMDHKLTYEIYKYSSYSTSYLPE